MAVRTCLLVSDDPDDHAELTEALYDLFQDVVVLLVSDNRRAAHLILSGRHIPDCLMIDVAVNGFDHNDFFTRLETDPQFAGLSLIIYGDEDDFTPITSKKPVIRLSRDLSFSDLKEVLRGVIPLT